MAQKYGKELVEQLEKEIARLEESISNRWDRINEGMTDMDDCFMSERCEERGIQNNKDKIALINKGGCEWFLEYATLDGKLVDAHWCNTRRLTVPSVYSIYDMAEDTVKVLKQLKLKDISLFGTSQGGMLGVYTGQYVYFPSDVNYATGEPAGVEPLEIRDC